MKLDENEILLITSHFDGGKLTQEADHKEMTAEEVLHEVASMDVTFPVISVHVWTYDEGTIRDVTDDLALEWLDAQLDKHGVAVERSDCPEWVKNSRDFEGWMEDQDKL